MTAEACGRFWRGLRSLQQFTAESMYARPDLVRLDSYDARWTELAEASRRMQNGRAGITFAGVLTALYLTTHVAIYGPPVFLVIPLVAFPLLVLWALPTITLGTDRTVLIAGPGVQRRLATDDLRLGTVHTRSATYYWLHVVGSPPGACFVFTQTGRR